MTPDHVARNVIVASYCYYVLDHPIMDDGEYDALCQYVAANWEQLEPDRKWALGDPESIKASGFHIKYSSYAVAAAGEKYKEKYLDYPSFYPKYWQYREDGCRYITGST